MKFERIGESLYRKGDAIYARVRIGGGVAGPHDAIALEHRSQGQAAETQAQITEKRAAGVMAAGGAGHGDNLPCMLM